MIAEEIIAKWLNALSLEQKDLGTIAINGSDIGNLVLLLRQALLDNDKKHQLKEDELKANIKEYLRSRDSDALDYLEKLIDPYRLGF